MSISTLRSGTGLVRLALTALADERDGAVILADMVFEDLLRDVHSQGKSVLFLQLSSGARISYLILAPLAARDF